MKKVARRTPGWILVVLLAFFVSARAADYYVAPPPPGNDSNPGTSPSSLWATVGKTAGIMSAGDTVYIMSGTYNVAFLT